MHNRAKPLFLTLFTNSATQIELLSIRLFHGSGPLEARSPKLKPVLAPVLMQLALMQSENRIAPITDFYLSTDA
jgi:hypothetical protein